MTTNELAYIDMLAYIDKALLSKNTAELRIIGDLEFRKQRRGALAEAIVVLGNDNSIEREERINIIIESLAKWIDIKKFATRANLYNKIEKPNLDYMKKQFCYNICPQSHSIRDVKGFLGRLNEFDFRCLLKTLPDGPEWNKEFNSEIIKLTIEHKIMSDTEALREMYFSL